MQMIWGMQIARSISRKWTAVERLKLPEKSVGIETKMNRDHRHASG